MGKKSVKNCPACGGEVAQEVNICERCGQRLGKGTPDVYPVKDPSTGPLFEVRLGHYLGTGWEAFRLYPAGFIGFSFIMLIVMASQISLTKKIYFIGFLLGITIYPLYIGNYIVSAKLLQRQPCNFADFFSSFHYYQPLIIFNTIYMFFGTIQYMIPQHMVLRGIIILAELLFFVFFLFTPLLIVDRHLGWWQAMELSWKTVQRRWLKFLGYIFLVCSLLPVIFLIISMLMKLIPASFQLKF